MNRFLHLRLRGAGSFLCRSTTDFPVADPAVGRGGDKHETYAFAFGSPFYGPQRSWGKVMFLHLSVSHSVHRGDLPYPPDRHPPWPDTPLGWHPRAVHAGTRSTSGRYASYWNAILFMTCFSWPGRGTGDIDLPTESATVFLTCISRSNRRDIAVFFFK